MSTATIFAIFVGMAILIVGVAIFTLDGDDFTD